LTKPLSGDHKKTRGEGEKKKKKSQGFRRVLVRVTEVCPQGRERKKVGCIEGGKQVTRVGAGEKNRSMGRNGHPRRGDQKTKHPMEIALKDQKERVAPNSRRGGCTRGGMIATQPKEPQKKTGVRRKWALGKRGKKESSELEKPGGNGSHGKGSPEKWQGQKFVQGGDPKMCWFI